MSRSDVQVLKQAVRGNVAATLERSVGAVHMLRARAHDRLRELLGSESRFSSDKA